MTILPDEKKLAKYFSYLDDLRESGVTNMPGARPYLMGDFPELDGERAARVLTAWMKTFSRDLPPTTRAINARKEKP